NSGVGGLVRGLVNILYGQPLPRPFSELPVIALSDSAKAHYAGDYLFPDADSTRATVRLRDSRLMMIIPGHPEFELLPVAPWQFKSGTTRIEFMPGAQGQRDQVFLYRKGEISGATRVPVPAGTIPLQ
ncbi:MAG TPA: hypothetical protein VHK69_05540, partial [Chitinophagaceae bacterium]|nr:hypothetical protein [Chitinophagaceae bacterium]